jgi:hypothetical protein
MDNNRVERTRVRAAHACRYTTMIEYRVKKIRASSRRTVGIYFHVHQKLKLIEPLMSDLELIDIINSHGGGNGLLFLRGSIFVDCVHNCAVLAFDHDDRTASLKTILQRLDSGDLQLKLREEFSQSADSASDKKEQDERFDTLLAKIRNDFCSLEKNILAQRFCSIRDKVTAHLEMKSVDLEPKPVTASDFELKWGDVELFLQMVEPIVFDLQQLLERTSYVMESYYGTHSSVAEEFWAPYKIAGRFKKAI